MVQANFSTLINNELNKLIGPGIIDYNLINDNPKTTIEFGKETIYNNHDFRGPDFKKNIDLLFAGCSHTFGVGLTEDEVWGVQLAKKNNWSYNNLSYPGSSVMHLVHTIFKYFKLYGHPKYLVAVFPSYARVRSYIDNEYLRGPVWPFPVKDHQTDYDKYGPHNVYGSGEDIDNKNYERYIRLPATADQIFGDNYTYMLNAIFINILEQYCEEHNIVFVWSKWARQYLDESSHVFFKNEYELGEDIRTLQNIGERIDCSHPDLIAKYPDTYDLASDNLHYGTHWHYHVSELFDGILNDNFRS